MPASIELLWRCRTLAQERQTLLQTHTEVGALGPTAATHDAQLMGAEIIFGSTVLGHVEGLSHDPFSHRVRRLITSYGPTGRRVGVPVEWVVRRSATRVVLGVGARSLDDLGDWTRA